MVKTLSIIIGACIALTAGNVMLTNEILDYDWVAGKYGSKCYSVRSVNKNIKYHVYFKTEEECLDYVNN